MPFQIKNGKIVINTDGKIVICEDCPEDCGPQVQTFCSVDWLDEFDVTLQNFVDGGCANCDEVMNIVVPVTYNGQQMSADFGGTNWHWWRAETIYAPDCGGDLTNRSLNIYAQYVPSLGNCVTYGIIYQNATADPINQTMVGAPGFAVQAGLVGYTAGTPPLNLSINSGTQCSFNGCSVSAIPAVIMVMDPWV